MSRVYCMAFIESEIQPKMIERQRKALEAALSNNPETEKRLRKFIREVLIDARKNMIGDAQSAMKDDPRGSAYSIRTSVYKAILGGNVNIFDSRKAGKRTTYIRERTLDKNKKQRGGNRRPKTYDTMRINSYGPHDRGFILRFVNDGTGIRKTRYGNRGAIAARNFFGPSAQRWVQQAADNLNRLIYAEVKNLMIETN